MPAPRRRLVVTVIAVIAVVVIGLFVRARTSGDGAHAAKTGGDGPAQRAVAVTVAKVEKKDAPVWLEGLGTVSAWQQVTVRPQVDGRLDKVLFNEGQLVHKGDVLA